MPPSRVKGNLQRRIIVADGCDHIIGEGGQLFGVDIEMAKLSAQPGIVKQPRAGADGGRRKQRHGEGGIVRHGRRWT